MAMGNKCLPFLTGMLAAGLSNLFLGLSSLYWKVFHDMNAIALVGYRVVLSLATVTLILWVKRDLLALFHRLKLRQVVLHGCAAVLVATNWGGLYLGFDSRSGAGKRAGIARSPPWPIGAFELRGHSSLQSGAALRDRMRQRQFGVCWGMTCEQAYDGLGRQEQRRAR